MKIGLNVVFKNNEKISPYAIHIFSDGFAAASPKGPFLRKLQALNWQTSKLRETFDTQHYYGRGGDAGHSPNSGGNSGYYREINSVGVIKLSQTGNGFGGGGSGGHVQGSNVRSGAVTVYW